MHPTTRGVLRRTAAGTTCTAAALLTLTAPAGADAATTIDAEYWGISCVADLGEGRTLFLTGSGTTDGTQGGVGAFVEASDGSVVADGEATAFTFGTTFAATIPLGGTTFSITADADEGPRTTDAIAERDGNAWTRGTLSHADLALTGVTASYDGRPVALGTNACSGDVQAFDVRTTDPAAYVASSGDFLSDICEVAGLPDAQVRLTGALPDAYVEVVLDHGAEDVEKAQGELRVAGRRASLQTEVRDVFTGEVRTTATIGLALARAGTTVRETWSADGLTDRQSLTPYRATIDVVLADGRSGTATCAALAVTTQVRIQPVR